MRKMKKILAWLTVLTVNVSMMPMPTVAAATATDASTASNEETTTSDATKEATQAQEVAKKAVEKASKTATTTAAKKTTTETKKATNTKKSRSVQSLENTIEEGIFKDRDQTKIDVSDYDASKSEVKSATKEVLKDNDASKVVDVTYDTGSDGKVENVNVNIDPVAMQAMDELDEINEKTGAKATDEQLQKAYDAYIQLQTFYEANPDYFGIAAPYFTSKDSEGTPIRGILAVANIEYEALLQSDDALNTVVGLIQGYYGILQQMITPGGQYYDTCGKKLLEVRDKVVAITEKKKTTAEKLLAINDWLGNYATFDMAYIKDQMQSDIEGSSSSGTQQLSQDDDMKQLYEGILRSSAFGVLTGNRTSVCLSYTAAYNYLVQCAFPEIYKKKNEDGTYGDWKKKDDVNGIWEPVYEDAEKTTIKTFQGKKQYQLAKNSPEPTYMVDYVRIQWKSDVSMYGNTETFNNPHYFSAVKAPTSSGDESWYYVDSCYNDIYVECLQRNRVETDGNMSHSYFLISDTTLRKQFDGNYEYIDSLYKDKSSDKSYEESWVTKSEGPIYTDENNEYYYYVKNTSSYSMGSGSNSINYKKGSDQLVRVKCGDGLLSSDGEEVLIDYKDGTGSIEKGEGADLVTNAYKEDVSSDSSSDSKKEKTNSEKYPGTVHTAAYYDGAVYFNISNKIYKYDVKENKVTKVKEYNKVSATQDTTNAFTGMSYTITNKEDDENIVHTVYNHPIAGLAIKEDDSGNAQLHVAIATNYSDYGKYEYEETNYNSSYVNYGSMTSGGDNDNGEFQWSANFVETIPMSHIVAGESEHDYQKVTVAPTCTEEGYTEERCTVCGEAKEGTKEADGEKATGHHYVKAHEYYFTKPKKDEKWGPDNRKEGDFYLCTECLDTKDSESDLSDNSTVGHKYEIDNTKTKWNDDHSEVTVEVTCKTCENKELDVLKDEANNGKDVQVLTKTGTSTDIKSEKDKDFDCEKGGKVTYTATVTIDGVDYPVSDTVEVTEHKYPETPEYTWTEDGTKCTATLKCTVCENAVSATVDATAEVKKPTCTEDGKTVHTAKVTLNGKEYTTTKDTDVVKATGHDYEAKFNWAEDHKTCTVTLTCQNDNSHVIKDAKCHINDTVVEPGTCETEGKTKHTASYTVDDKTFSEDYVETVAALGHKYKVTNEAWSKADDGAMTYVATLTCEHNKDHVEIVPVKEGVTSDNGTVTAQTIKEATCTEDGSIKYTATVKFNDQEFTAEKTVTVEKTGHKYDDNGVCTVCGHKKPVITLKAKKAVYTGKAISIDEPTITEGEVVNLNYSYYSDKDCKNEISEPVNPGVYYVTVTADAGSDNAGVTSNKVTLTIVPQAVKVASVSNASSYVKVTWNKANKASGYYVYRSTNGKKFTKIATVKSGNTVKYNDKKATKNGQKYVYKVVTYYNGNQKVSSAYSAVKTGYRLSTMKVSSLTNKKGKKVYIKWKKNPKSTGYQIKYVTGKSKAKTVKASSKAKTKTISKLKKGKTYKVRIRSYKKVSNVTYYSAWSKQKSVKIKK